MVGWYGGGSTYRGTRDDDSIDVTTLAAWVVWSVWMLVRKPAPPWHGTKKNYFSIVDSCICKHVSVGRSHSRLGTDEQ